LSRPALPFARFVLFNGESDRERVKARLSGGQERYNLFMENQQASNVAQAIYHQSEERPFSVSQALRLVKSTLEQLHLKILGEISEISNNPNYKAVYFTIRDKSAALPCLIWRDRYRMNGVDLAVGQKVEVDGYFSVYAAKGRMNFTATAVQPAGEGVLRAQVAALAKKLEAEGLFQHQKELDLPELALRVGVVTSPSGKAVHDVLRTLRRRFPAAHVLFAGVRVEGAGAEQQIARGLRVLAGLEGGGVGAAGIAAPGGAAAGGAEDALPEVILLVRGGGSYEDLMPFNSEVVARQIAALPIPVITGIGHEPDTTIADMCACRRASTPTAAAEAAVPQAADLILQLAQLRAGLRADFLARLNGWRSASRAQASRLALQNPQTKIRSQLQELALSGERLNNLIEQFLAADRPRLERASTRLDTALRHGMELRKHKLSSYAQGLEQLSPLNVLKRGYALTYREGQVASHAEDFRAGDHIAVRMQDGRVEATVSAVEVAAASSQTTPRFCQTQAEPPP
jgi:exodeoxyribonuclease VII large subunit